MASFIALTGFMGSGKSSLGELLAKRLGLQFVDLDREIEKSLDSTIEECFQTEGEESFRSIERDALLGILSSSIKDSAVLALGGGTLEDAVSREAVGSSCTVVYLRVSAEEAWRRVSGSCRPLARDLQSFKRLLADRERTYEDSADWVLDAEHHGLEEIATDVEGLVLRGCHETRRCWARRLGRTSRDSLIIGGSRALGVVSDEAAAVSDAGGKLRVMTDENVMRALGEDVLARLGVCDVSDVCVLAPGEASKSPAALERCWEWLADRRATRDDVVVALGGGVVGDVAGLVAATYHRGIGLWQIPTSLLAQVDSSVGGKTAINLPSGKNLVGAFYQADLVVVDPGALATLPEEEYKGALGEVVKHGLLESEGSFAALEKAQADISERDPESVSRLVKRNIWYKASVVEEDEKESGKRAVLNLGHTVAHALESSLGYGRVSHGQAVALGLLVSLVVSEELLGIGTDVRMRTQRLLENLGLETSIDVPDLGALMKASRFDKKKRSGSSGFVGLRAIGEPVWGLDVSYEVLKEAVGVIVT